MADSYSIRPSHPLNCNLPSAERDVRSRLVQKLSSFRSSWGGLPGVLSTLHCEIS
jgi:hypothetical protein